LYHGSSQLAAVIVLAARGQAAGGSFAGHWLQARNHSGWLCTAFGSTSSVADAPSELAAVESALTSCTQADEACQLYAIGKFPRERGLIAGEGHPFGLSVKRSSAVTRGELHIL